MIAFEVTAASLLPKNLLGLSVSVAGSLKHPVSKGR